MLHEEFAARSFLIRKSKRPFSAIVVNQTHEQNKVLIKGDGRECGEMSKRTQRTNRSHHEDTPIQKIFLGNVRTFCKTVEQLINTFLDETPFDMRQYYDAIPLMRALI